ncbi:hypothetical protein BGZ83_008896, partial [Gryganskiella cystojenkinii]
MYLLGAEIRSATTAMIYRKTLRLSPDARRKSSSGAILTHLSVDAALWEEGLITLSMFFSLPWDFSLCIFLRKFQYERLRYFARMEQDRMEATDERVQQTTETLSNIKIVKLYGWEIPMTRWILDYRSKELKTFRQLGIFEAIMSLVFASSSTIISLVTFACYVTLGKGVLTPKIVFVSLTLLKMLHEPIRRMTEGTSNAISLLVATRRIQRFLLREEIDETQIEREEYKVGEDNVIEIKDATMTWTLGGDGNTEDLGDDKDEDEDDKDEDEGEHDEEGEQEPLSPEVDSDRVQVPALRDINLTVKDKSIVAVVGRVGMGKSSLLSAIIGDMYKVQGSIKTRGRIAYVPQQAWIVNATLRDNILFGKEYDPVLYRKVLSACSLDPDLAILPAGDKTEIGERGINLSGGQKQRVSLARATYQDADLYLLDDPLSAVDAHVDRHL